MIIYKDKRGFKMLQSDINQNNNKKIIIILICFVFIATIFVNKNIQNKKRISQGGVYAVSAALGHKVQHRVIKLPSNNAQYLSSSKEYGAAYNAGKILVIYPYPDANSPFSKVFSQEFDKILENPKYTSFYEFATFPQNPNNQFFMTCHSICFVNPKKEELLYITRTGNEAGKMLPMILDELMKW